MGHGEIVDVRKTSGKNYAEKEARGLWSGALVPV
jgi:hypothetical protein